MSSASTSAAPSRSRAIRESLGHPIVDCDGHMLDMLPVLLEFLDEVGGSELVDRLKDKAIYRLVVHQELLATTAAQRRQNWQVFDAWWASTTKTLDRATVLLPGLLEERMGELGLDMTVLHPSESGIVSALHEEDLRLAGCRAHNRMVAELFRDHPSILPVALIPMRTPREAVAELQHAVGELGLKAVNMGGAFPRHIAGTKEEPLAATPHATRPEVFGIDSEYDYDSVWATCRELGVAPAFHGKVQRQSISSYVYNHIGAFGVGGEAICKALFLGGVTRRFPDVNFAFLEGGVAWASSLLSDLVSHWEKRGADAIEQLDPAGIDVEQYLALVDRYGEERQRRSRPNIESYLGITPSRPERLDEFEACEIGGRDDLYDLFVPPFFFGCEADAPLNSLAFNQKVNPFGAKLQAMLGSDLGHWDVPDFRGVVAEAYELVEHGLMTEEDLRAFSFENPVRFFGGMNASFFHGTTIEAEAAAVLAASPAQIRFAAR